MQLWRKLADFQLFGLEPASRPGVDELRINFGLRGTATEQVVRLHACGLGTTRPYSVEVQTPGEQTTTIP